jgi:hypothetical protein
MDNQTTLIEVIRPLLELRLLEEVSIFLPIPTVEVDEVQSFAISWPNLKAFRLGPVVQAPQPIIGTGGRPPPVNAIDCLSTFARACPNLITLEIRMDQNSHLPCLSSIQPSSHELQTLELDIVGVREYLALARILCRIFPLVQDVKVHPNSMCSAFIQQLQGIGIQGRQAVS